MINWDATIKTVTGATVVNFKDEPMTLRSYCIEMVCVESEDVKDTAEERIRRSVIAHKLVEGHELTQEQVEVIGSCIKKFSVVSVLVSALKALELPIE